MTSSSNSDIYGRLVQDGQTALAKVAIHGKTDAMRLLVELGANVNHATKVAIVGWGYFSAANDSRFSSCNEYCCICSSARRCWSMR
jgi:hypothetical protein